ncbi:hypothetical protein DPMN_000688 [Dreissena polymorpha]|uniref:Uncharacterized protein n=1 Tax=Dreissena polymorpha TaxID=45954 RepID=A0A9D4RS18_DREPO|nr:hypothetical protein DPMN_000688 [Dreissena polymorpha]
MLGQLLRNNTIHNTHDPVDSDHAVFMNEISSCKDTPPHWTNEITRGDLKNAPTVGIEPMTSLLLGGHHIHYTTATSSKTCDTDFSISSGGGNDLTRHLLSKAHTSNRSSAASSPLIRNAFRPTISDPVAKTFCFIFNFRKYQI